MREHGTGCGKIKGLRDGVKDLARIRATRVGWIRHRENQVE